MKIERLGHVVLKLRDRAKAEAFYNGILGLPAAAHGVSKSLYFADPDGNRIELYVDQSDSWKRDPASVASYKPLTL